MKILITGCAGFIGANFALYLLNSYPEDIIVGVDCLTYAANDEALSLLLKKENFTFYKENICNAPAMERVFSTEKPDVVVNFAAESHVDNSISNATPFIETNVRGTQILLDTSLRHEIKRFHQISTDEVYGDLPIDSTNKFHEDSPLNPSSPYSASKAAADLLALSYSRTYGLEVSISRSTNNYGIFQHKEKLIPMTIGKLIADEPVPIYGNGENIRDWLCVLDHCRAVDLIIRKGRGEIYNVSANNEWSNIGLVGQIMRLIGKPDGRIVFVEDRKGHDRKYAVNCDKLRALGWLPEADFERELKSTVEWYVDR